MILLGAALSAVSFTGIARAADAPAKPADAPATTTPPARPTRPSAADQLKTYRDRFEGLNLTDDQMKKIDGFLDTATAEVTKAGTDQEGRRAAGQAMRKLNEDVQSILTDTQKAALRTKQIGQMYDRMKTTYTADTLKLTDDQKTKINAIIDEAKTAAIATPPPAPDANANGGRRGGGGAAFAGMREMRTKIDAILTPEQQALLPQFGRGNRGNRGAGAGAPATPPPAPPAAK